MQTRTVPDFRTRPPPFPAASDLNPYLFMTERLGRHTQMLLTRQILQKYMGNGSEDAAARPAAMPRRDEGNVGGVRRMFAWRGIGTRSE